MYIRHPEINTMAVENMDVLRPWSKTAEMLTVDNVYEFYVMIP